ncbi:MAG TPA: lactate dehydrogenase, partial [Candidatus Bathyarchaeia archaeon]|nr:lactate dehydrogenase [Candidatus Bathyarchaeia archaeon]
MISIIGSGRVGSALAFLLASEALDDIVLVNKPKNKAIGESLDIMSALPAKTKVSITGTDEMFKIKKSDIVIITASAGTIKTERIDLLPFNVPIIQEISRDIRKFADDAKIIVVTNPVDIITYQVLKETGFDSDRVIGMGSSLDSTRFRYLVSKELT